jgi:hypothetical protein
LARARLDAVGTYSREDEMAVVGVFAGKGADGVLAVDDALVVGVLAREGVADGVFGREVREGARGVAVEEREAGLAVVEVEAVGLRDLAGVDVAESVLPVC